MSAMTARANSGTHLDRPFTTPPSPGASQNKDAPVRRSASAGGTKSDRYQYRARSESPTPSSRSWSRMPRWTTKPDSLVTTDVGSTSARSTMPAKWPRRSDPRADQRHEPPATHRPRAQRVLPGLDPSGRSIAVDTHDNAAPRSQSSWESRGCGIDALVPDERSGAAQESNLPRTGLQPPAGFEAPASPRPDGRCSFCLLATATVPSACARRSWCGERRRRASGVLFGLCYEARAGHGTTPVAVVPWPRSLLISIRPPIVSMRSWMPVRPTPLAMVRWSKPRPVS